MGFTTQQANTGYPTVDIVINLIQQAIKVVLGELAARIDDLDDAKVHVADGDFTITDESVIEYNGTGGNTIRLPLADDLGPRRARQRRVLNTGTASVTVEAQGGNTVAAAASVTVLSGVLAIFETNGDTKWLRL